MAPSPLEVTLSCECGAVRGVAREVSPGAVNHVICYCADCQSFAHFLGRADGLLDRHGGSQIVQLSPARLAFTQGHEQLACMRLRPDGLVRWYTRCCRSPIGNTLLGPRPPFIGLLRSLLLVSEPAEAVLGPVAHVNPGSARDRDALGVPIRPHLGMLFRIGVMMLRWWLAGDPRRSPLRTPAGAPLVAPEVLSAEALREIERARDAWQPRS